MEDINWIIGEKKKKIKKDEEFKVIAFDHGTSSGYCVLSVTKDKKVKIIEKGLLQFFSTDNLEKIYNVLEPIFRKHYDAQILYTEKINVMGSKFNATAIIRLAEIRSIAKLLAYESNMDVEEVNPTSMKKYITGNGRADKMTVARSICDLFDLDIRFEVPKLNTTHPRFDMLDALAIGYYGLGSITFRKDKNNINYLEIIKNASNN